MIEILPWGDFDENTYVVGDAAECVVIDPGAPASEISPLIGGRNVAAILLTHTHFDHILGVDELRTITGARVHVPIGEKTGLEDPNVNLSAPFGMEVRRKPADAFIMAGDQFRAGSIILTAADAPGHSVGHVVFKGDGFVISGDTLFSGSIGRTDFPGASCDTLLASIRRELLTLADETVVYPGHGPKTTIGTERKYNPFLTQ